MHSVRRASLPLLVALLGLNACAVAPIPAGTVCDTGSFEVDDEFTGARRGDCIIKAADAVRLKIVPEDERVTNASPWFAFRLRSDAPVAAEITLEYGDWEHRYIPKTSRDGINWTPLPDADWGVSDDGTRARLRLRLDGSPLWVAAHELELPAQQDAWNQRIAESGVARLSIAGRSILDLPIWVLDTAGADQRPVVLLTSRQHPPEVSGVSGFRGFADTVMGESELAGSFRERFRIIAFPLLNPDGVVRGHWRHNLGETDLNRDWGPFAQPETSLISDLLDRLDSELVPVAAFVDFHSTRKNVFYTQSEPTSPPGFSATWLDRSAERITDYEFENDPRPTSDTANGKNYMYKRYGIPSLTYEVGDETDRDSAYRAAVVFAEEFMQLWLEISAGEGAGR